MYNSLHIQFLRSHDTDACSYLKGTSVKLNKDIVLGMSLENLLCLGTGYCWSHSIQELKFIWAHFEVRFEQTHKYLTVASKRN